MIDWWALRWMSPGQFAALAGDCGFPLDATDLARLSAADLLQPLETDLEPAYSVAHLLVLWSYRQLVVAWHHPWREGGPGPIDATDLEGFRERFRAFRDWLIGGRFDEEWWEQIEAKMRRLHPLGRARQMGLLLDPSVLESVTGEARLFLELDRFFAAWNALVEQRRREGFKPPSALHLRLRPELDSASGPYPPVQRPAALPDDSEAAATRPVGLDESDLHHESSEDSKRTSNGVLTPGEAAREHARRAAEETSALIPLSVAEQRSDRSERLSAFEARERELFEAARWEHLAEHYRASLDIFNDDAEVGRVLKKLALVYLEKLNQPDEGTHFYLRALERLPTDPAALKTADRLLAEQQRWEELTAIWQRTAIHAEGTQSSEAWMRVASILLEHMRNMPEAIQALRYALEADPANENAREALSNLAALSPEERSGSHHLESTQAEWSKLAGIAERWAKRLEKSEDAAEWYERAAELHLSGKDGADAAFACLEAALERDPERMSALSRLESLARHQDRWETFRDVMVRFIDRETDDGNELQLSLVAETFRDRLKDGGVPEALYTELLEKLPPSTRVRDASSTPPEANAAAEARSPAGHHSELARQLILEAGGGGALNESATNASGDGEEPAPEPAEPPRASVEEDAEPETTPGPGSNDRESSNEPEGP